jgi:hypothetical protein
MRRWVVTLVALSVMGASRAPAAVITVSPLNPGGWGFSVESGSNAGGNFQNVGPGTPPYGSGSVRLQVGDAASGIVFGRLGWNSLRLADIAELSYWTYQTSASSPALLPALQIPYDADVFDTDLSFQGRLVFEPYLATGLGQPVQNATWQNWDTLDLNANGWWATGGPVQTPRGVLAPLLQLCQRMVGNRGTGSGGGLLRQRRGCVRSDSRLAVHAREDH